MPDTPQSAVAAPASPAAPPAAPSNGAPNGATATLSLAEQISQLNASPSPALPVAEPSPTPAQPVSEPDAVADTTPDSTTPSPATEVLDDEEFRLSWEEDTPTDAPPTSSSTQPSPAPPAKLTAEEISEVKQHLLGELELTPDQTEKAWGKLLQLSRPRKALEAFKTLRDLEKPWEEGGVGYIPNTDEVRQLVQSKIAYNDLMQDLTSGEPQRVSDAWSFIFNPATSDDGQSTLRPGIESAVADLPRVLATSSVPLYNAIAKPILTNYVNMLYDAGEQESDPEQKAWLINTARGMDYRLTGSYRKDSGKPNGHSAPRASDTPKQDQRLSDEIRRRDERIRSLERTQLDSFQSSISSSEDAIINQGLDEALAIAKETYPANVYSAVRKDFAAQIRNSISNNPVFQREYDSLLTRAYQSGNSQDREQLSLKFRQQAGVAIKRYRTQFIKSIQSTNAERRTEAERDKTALASVQTKVGPTSTGQPAPNQVAATDQPRPAGMSSRDWLTQRISQISSAATVH